jgi:hypothetical protein
LFASKKIFGPFAFPLLATFLFYYPSIRNGSRDAGFLFGSNMIDVDWPYIAKLQALESKIWRMTHMAVAKYFVYEDRVLPGRLAGSSIRGVMRRVK